jgi:hypothetical protein
MTNYNEKISSSLTHTSTEFPSFGWILKDVDAPHTIFNVRDSFYRWPIVIDIITADIPKG